MGEKGPGAGNPGAAQPNMGKDPKIGPATNPGGGSAPPSATISKTHSNAGLTTAGVGGTARVRQSPSMR